MTWEDCIDQINKYKYLVNDGSEELIPSEIVIDSSILLAKYLQFNDHKTPDLIYITFSGSILFEWNYGNKIKTSLTKKIIQSCYKEIEIDLDKQNIDTPAITMSIIDLENDNKHIMNIDNFNILKDYYFLYYD